MARDPIPVRQLIVELDAKVDDWIKETSDTADSDTPTTDIIATILPHIEMVQHEHHR